MAIFTGYFDITRGYLITYSHGQCQVFALCSSSHVISCHPPVRETCVFKMEEPKKHPAPNVKSSYDPPANMTQNCGLVVENYEFSRCGVKIPNRVLFLIFLWFKLTKFWIKLTELIKFRQRLQKSMDHDGS